MNTKALITTLAVLGSTSSLAMAQPATHNAVSVSAGARLSWNPGAPVRAYPAPIPAPVVRDHRSPYVATAPIVVRPVAHRRGDIEWTRGYDPGYAGAYDGRDDRQPGATLLADGLTYNTGEYRKDIVLEGRGRFNTLVLDEQGGCTSIKEVRIEFMGGAVQSIPVNQSLTGNQSMTFDLDGHDRAINRIFVYGAGGDNRNIGRPGDGEFSVAAL